MKGELNAQVDDYLARCNVNNAIDDRIKFIDEFNGKLKIYFGVVSELEKWNIEGRKRMEELINPPAPIEAEDRVLMTMELGEDVTSQLELHGGQQVCVPVYIYHVTYHFTPRLCGIMNLGPKKLPRLRMNPKLW